MSALWYRGAERLPATLALSLIPSLPRAHLERLVQQLIDRMDEADGDPDIEAEETDHSSAEDDCPQELLLRASDGPGCPVADSDCDMSDTEDNGDREDNGDAERNAMPPHWSMNQ